MIMSYLSYFAMPYSPKSRAWEKEGMACPTPKKVGHHVLLTMPYFDFEKVGHASRASKVGHALLLFKKQWEMLVQNRAWN